MPLEDRITAIETRNARVAVDKAWETSATRRISIAVITYICASILFVYVTPSPEWPLAALVPVMGYLLSTLGLPQIRKIWERKKIG
ncbi:MAG: hypothetical protein HYS17_03035 [Micavibrio aeruginosavorus]|uniref:Uncharacterized protein n=1 Tax=Micavibrio aeruginosavorus TaxID=349221 RepID=A0A7T5R3A1_9BACT|nr:MAG: hypothetical protein HYS17_03035 [Micavibrio aeruginosavorus]